MTRAAAVAAAVLVVAPAAHAYPWPVKPFDRSHPVRGNFGDPRTVFFNQPPGSLEGPGRFSFHDGIDIAAAGGTRVYPVVDGIAHYVNSTAIAVRSFGVQFRYVHVDPVVREGQQVYARRTVLGTVEPWAGHVHLTEIQGGHAVNPLRPGGVEPYVDHTEPAVTELIVRRPDGTDVEKPFEVCGAVAIAAAAYDTPSLTAPGAWAGLPVTPARLSWSLKAIAGPLIVPTTVVRDFLLKRLPPRRDFWRVYLRGTFQNSAHFGLQRQPGLAGRFLFFVTHRLDTTTLPDGDYTITVSAQDARGNQGMLSETISVANLSAACSG